MVQFLGKNVHCDFLSADHIQCASISGSVSGGQSAESASLDHIQLTSSSTETSMLFQNTDDSVDLSRIVSKVTTTTNAENELQFLPRGDILGKGVRITPLLRRR